MSATSSQPAIKFIASRHLGTKWCGWCSTRPKDHFEPLISSGHFDPLVSVVQFRPLIFHKSTGCFRPMICPLFGRKYAKLRVSFVFSSSFFRVFFVFVPFWVRIRCTSLRRLEVVYRLDSTDNLCSRLDVLHDLVHALISHRRLIKGVGHNAGGVDPCHFSLVLCHSETLKGS